MTQLHEETLFWLFIFFFSAIGLISLLVQIRILEASEDFRKWSLKGFIAGVVALVVGLTKIALFPSAPQLNAPILASIAPEGIDEKGLRNFKITEAWLVETQGVGPQKPGTTEKVSIPKERELKRIPPSAGPSWQVEIPPDILGSVVRVKVKDDTDVWWESSEFSTNFVGNLNVAKKQLRSEPAALFLPVAMAAEDPMSSRGGYPKFNNYARPIEKFDGRQYYEWRVFIDESDEILNTIRDVRYLLHPTFPNRIQLKCDPSTNFALQSSGWGEFTLSITIRYKDKREVAVNYFLDLNKSWPREREKDLTPERPCTS